jgi:hypothetical protein
MWMLRPDIMSMGRGGIVGLLLDHLAFLISKGCRNDIGYFTIVILLSLLWSQWPRNGRESVSGQCGCQLT